MIMHGRCTLVLVNVSAIGGQLGTGLEIKFTFLVSFHPYRPWNDGNEIDVCMDWVKSDCSLCFYIYKVTFKIHFSSIQPYKATTLIEEN
jgi:hypothetical protein